MRETNGGRQACVQRQGNILYDYVPNTATNKAAMLAYLSGDPALPPDFFEENVIFEGTPSEIFQPEISAAMRNAILARGIPALSPVMGGANIAWNVAIDIDPTDMNNQSVQFRPNGWGRNHQRFAQRWLHGDLKDMAFFFNFKCFESIVLQGELK